MNIDYERLEELLDGSSPGPWGDHEEEGELGFYEGVTRFAVADINYVEIARGEAGATEKHAQSVSNFALIALAPDMARELLRLRRELTDLRDFMRNHVTHLEGDGYGIAANCAHNYAHRITRIMQGDDE